MDIINKILSENCVIKKCIECNCEKLIYEFNKSKKHKTGINSVCKICVNKRNAKYRKKNKDKIAMSNKKYSITHKKEITAKNLEYKKKNKEKLKEWFRQYHQDNKEKRNRQSILYYQENKKIINIKAKKYKQDNKENISAQGKAYYEANKEKCLKDRKEYQQNNKKRTAARKKIYRIKNIEAISKRDKKYWEDNREVLLMKKREYLQTDRGKELDRIGSQKRRALKAGAKYEKFSSIEIFERDGYKCQHCNKKTRPDFKNPNHPLYPNLDHIILLSKGGDHTRLNTQCLCRLCNMKKHNNTNGEQLRLFG